MILSIVLFSVFILLASGFLFFFFYFFIPALKSKYYGVSSILSTEKNVSYEAEKEDRIVSNREKQAVVTSAQKNPQDRRLVYTGLKNCAVFHATYGSEYHDFYGCSGFGDCMKACHQNAIQLEKGIAVVTDLCDGCGACVGACPVGLISLKEKKSVNLPIPPKKRFKFWRSCYRILTSGLDRS